jgi:DNA-binding NarL/FixJ family response regulator
MEELRNRAEASPAFRIRTGSSLLIRVESAATKLGFEVVLETNLESLLNLLKQSGRETIIVNLDALEGKIIDLTGLLQRRAFNVVAYYSHVNADLAKQAAKIGLRFILPRSVFVSKIEETLRQITSQPFD